MIYPLSRSPLQEPDLLIHLFIFLAFSNESDLGFDTEIERVNNLDFELRFPIKETNYLTSIVLYDVGADSMCGRGTWVFEAYLEDQTENSKPHVIKDCWVEDRPGKQMEHAIIEQARKAIGHEQFREHFVDFRAYRKATNEALARFYRVPSGSDSDTGLKTYPLLRESGVDHGSNYSQVGQVSVADQSHHLGSGAGSATHQRRLHPRFRYQIVYAERGTSLYDITSLSETFEHLIGVVEGTEPSIMIPASSDTHA